MKLTISLAQIDVAQGDPAANFKKAAAWTAEAARRGSDLIVFPEMWTTGCDWNNIEALAPGGGYVFNTVHNIQADVPVENIIAMYETLQEFGVY